jgi:hypothetical protein
MVLLMKNTWTAWKMAAILAAFVATPALADSWGAIAIDLGKFENSPYYGVGGGESEDEATSNSLKFCKEAGGESCKSVVTYNACGAYAASHKHGGWGKSSTKKEAEVQALAGCGDEHCVVVVSDCN